MCDHLGPKRSEAIDIGEWAICGGVRLERFDCILKNSAKTRSCYLFMVCLLVAESWHGNH